MTTPVAVQIAALRKSYQLGLADGRRAAADAMLKAADDGITDREGDTTMQEKRYDDPAAGLTAIDRQALEGRLRRLERNGQHAEAAAARQRFGLPPSDPYPEVDPLFDPVGWIEKHTAAAAEADLAEILAMETLPAEKPPTDVELVAESNRWLSRDTH